MTTENTNGVAQAKIEGPCSPTRIRTPLHGCWDCKSYYPEGLDEPDDPSFCVLDGTSVMLWQHCSSWGATTKLGKNIDARKLSAVRDKKSQ